MAYPSSIINRVPRKNSRNAKGWRDLVFWAAVVLLSVFSAICMGNWLKKYLASENENGDTVYEVTGYCNCGKCCGWTRDKNGRPVYNYGSMKGKPKIIGRTSTGTTARRGTIAADPKVLKMGTKLEIPGYGQGVVEDVGGAIKGRHIDLWFPTHEEAKKWGKQYLRIKILDP